jgi:hypothetical protein
MCSVRAECPYAKARVAGSRYMNAQPRVITAGGRSTAASNSALRARGLDDPGNSWRG